MLFSWLFPVAMTTTTVIGKKEDWRRVHDDDGSMGGAFTAVFDYGRKDRVKPEASHKNVSCAVLALLSNELAMCTHVCRCRVFN